jgi:ubiquinone/menaquinone biosynthesis C-methylase UbiE
VLLIFQPFAADLPQRVASLASGAVSATVTRTAVVTCAKTVLRRKLYVVTDLNQPKLDIAASQQIPGRSIQWRKADAPAFPFENSAFDLVTCQQ